ncbi:MAG: peptidoglycan-binding protein [Desulfuromonadales bacterium]|nr:peptidoglycan-binding protein [Desulfuromonadales bacterium]
MKTSTIHGWALIFTATFLLAACASHEAKMADTDLMSGPDVTMTQLEEQKQRLERQENAIVVSRGWLDERALQLDNREFDLDRRENALIVTQAWVDERELQLDEQAFDLDRKENAVIVSQAWLEEHERQLDAKAFDLTQQQVMANYQAATEPGRCYASVMIPATYKTVAVIKPIITTEDPGATPMRYQTITTQELISNQHTEWKEILCETQVSPNLVSDVQQALTGAGFDPGPIDGVCGSQTMAAVNAFQKEHSLTIARHLTLETIEALGLSL